jgi:hypothetical protein
MLDVKQHGFEVVSRSPQVEVAKTINEWSESVLRKHFNFGAMSSRSSMISGCELEAELPDGSKVKVCVLFRMKDRSKDTFKAIGEVEFTASVPVENAMFNKEIIRSITEFAETSIIHYQGGLETHWSKIKVFGPGLKDIEKAIAAGATKVLGYNDNIKSLVSFLEEKIHA